MTADVDLQPTGIHHVSSLTSDIRRNLDFYTRVLGLRLVKRTVNQDEPTMYHLFYADGVGSPGSETTFFDMPLAAPGRRGPGSIGRTSYRVRDAASLRFWQARLAREGVPHGPVGERQGRPTLVFTDPDGAAAAIMADPGGPAGRPWSDGPVPEEHQIAGLGPMELIVADPEPSHRFLTDVLHLRRVGEGPHPDAPDARVVIYAMGEGGAASELHLAVRPELPRGRYGAGSVHHVALRVPDEAAHRAWQRRLRDAGASFHAVDRFYFRSIYVREPGGILVELATDGPGFTVDEPPDALGRRLALPPFLEGRREEIEARLAPLD